MTTLYVPVSRLRIRSNYRQAYDQDFVNSLIDDMRLHGFRESEPIETYCQDGLYYVIDGNTRYTAASMVNRLDMGVPFYVYITVSDTVPSAAEFISRQLSANETRRDPDLMSQAYGYTAAIEAGITVDELAHTISRKVEYVQKRLNLLRLTAEAQEMVKRRLLSIDYANELARLKAEYQCAALSAYTRASRHSFEDFKDLVDELYQKQVQAENEQLPLFGGELVVYTEQAMQRIAAKHEPSKAELQATIDKLLKQQARDRDYAKREYRKLLALYRALQTKAS